METKTLLSVKKIIEDKLQKSKMNTRFISDSERDTIYGKELAYEDMLDEVNDLLEESKNNQK